MRYVLVWIAAFALSELLIAFLHDGIGLSPIPTKLINDGVIGILIFTAHRLFTFR